MSRATEPVLDVTSRVENLGNPFNKGPYARNVWDMRLFNRRIYLGHGNSSNSAPDANAGPISVWYYDTDGNKFVNEYTVDEEQIDLYRVINKKLYIPGHDSRESWDFGNFYRLDNDVWTKIRTIPRGIHVYDLFLFQSKLFAALGTDEAKTIQMSADMGQTWQVALREPGRTHRFFKFKAELYASLSFVKSVTSDVNNTFRFNGIRFVNANVATSKMFPNYPTSNVTSYLPRVAEFNSQLLYIAAYNVNDHQWDPKALYTAPAIDQARKVTFPISNAFPYDILVRADKAYVLASAKLTSGQYVNAVYSSTDLNTWSEVFRFSASTFARSFEELNGDFYFGLGTDAVTLSSTSGDVLRVRRSALFARAN